MFINITLVIQNISMISELINLLLLQNEQTNIWRLSTPDQVMKYKESLTLGIIRKHHSIPYDWQNMVHELKYVKRFLRFCRKFQVNKTEFYNLGYGLFLECVFEPLPGIKRHIEGIF